MMFIRTYICGSIQAATTVETFNNLRRGIREAIRLLRKGYIPFCPFIDFQFFLCLQNGEEISLDQIQTYSKEWLRVCQVVYVLPNSDNSLGTQAEIALAQSLSIPVVYTEEDLQRVREQLIGVVRPT